MGMSGRAGSTRPRPSQNAERSRVDTRGEPICVERRLWEGARPAGDSAAHQRFGERHPLPSHQAQDQRRNPQRRRPRMPRRLPRPPQDLRQARHRFLGLPRRTPRSSRLPGHPHPRRNRQRARPKAALSAPTFAPVPGIRSSDLNQHGKYRYLGAAATSGRAPASQARPSHPSSWRGSP